MCDNCLFDLYGVHALCLVFVSFLLAGPGMVGRIRHSPEISHHGCSAGSGSERCVGKGKAHKKGSMGWPEEAPE